MRLSALKAHRKSRNSNNRPIFYYITGGDQPGGMSVMRCARRAMDWGVDFLQIREKALSERKLYDLTCRIVALARNTSCKVLLNGRADIALAAGADGVHLPSTGLQIADVRSWSPENFLVGISVHSLREIRKAEAQGADYILVGHVFPTESKEGYGPSLGLEFLRKACLSTSVPILGLGGMSADMIEPVLQTGAAGIAGITLFQNTHEFRRLKRWRRSAAKE